MECDLSLASSSTLHHQMCAGIGMCSAHTLTKREYTNVGLAYYSSSYILASSPICPLYMFKRLQGEAEISASLALKCGEAKKKQTLAISYLLQTHGNKRNTVLSRCKSAPGRGRVICTQFGEATTTTTTKQQHQPSCCFSSSDQH